MRITVVYYSATGTNYEMAGEAEKTVREAGEEVRLRRVRELAPPQAIETNPAWKAHIEASAHIPEVSLEDVEWADGLVFSVPTRFGNMAAQFKQFLDTAGPLWAGGKLVDKTVTAMTSAANDHGGQEATLLSLYTMMFHWGALVVTPGYTHDVVYGAGGNPYGTSATAGHGVSDAVRAAVRHQTQRLMDVTRRLKRD